MKSVDRLLISSGIYHRQKKVLYLPSKNAYTAFYFVGQMFNGVQCYLNKSFKGTFSWFKYHLSITSISRCPHQKLKFNILGFSDFAFSSCAQFIHELCVGYCKWSVYFYVVNIIGSDNHTIGTSAKINKSLQFCFRISCFS